jgi:hypothetical protein
MATTPILDDIAPLRDIAAELNIHPATAKRWADKPGGPPLIYVGRIPHANRVSWRQWFLNKERAVGEPEAVRRGRPRRVSP